MDNDNYEMDIDDENYKMENENYKMGNEDYKMGNEDYIRLVGYVFFLYITFICVCYLWTLFRCYFLTSLGFVKDLKKYGEWVVVTGATDGIGKQYARQLAKQGFKIVLISRNKDKLEKVAKEIIDEFGVETKIICFDFTQTDGYDVIEVAITGLDVGILVNNVGISVRDVGSFHSCDIAKVYDCMHVNMHSNIQMTHMLSRGMMERGRGAIIHISSLSTRIDMPILNVYPATKSFIDKFFRVLRIEHRGVIDHQLVITGYVATKASGRKPTFGLIPSAESYVSSALKTIGITDVTCGCLTHDLQYVLCMLLPESVQSLFSEYVRDDLMKRK